MGFFSRVVNFFRPAAAKPQGAGERVPTAQEIADALRKQINAPATAENDPDRYIARGTDFGNDSLKDPDPVIENDTDGFARLYANRHILSCLRRHDGKVSSATYSLHGDRSEDQAKLVPWLDDLAMTWGGLRELIATAMSARVQGINYQRLLFAPQAPETILGRPVLAQRPKKAARHDKRRFRIVSPDRSIITLVDDGTVTIGGLAYSLRPIDQRYYIVTVWQDDESRLGYGHGIGAQLDALAEEEEGAHRMFLRSLEKFAGGLVDVHMRDTSKAQAAGAAATVLTDAKRMKSGDTTVWPALVEKVVRTFPGEPSVRAFQLARAEIRTEMSVLINGTDFQNMGDTGTYGLGAALAGEELALAQVNADWIAANVIPRYLEIIVQQNPWVYEAAGVAPTTPLPNVRAEVDVGRSPKEAAEVIQILSNAGHKVTPETASELTGIAVEERVEPAPLFNPFGGGGLPKPSAVNADTALEAIGLVHRALKPGGWRERRRS